jgi:hypothetical protein
VNRLWEALVKGDAALWTRGLNELAEPPLGPDILGTSPPAGAVASSDLVHELAVVGLGAKDSAARGAVYGRLVAACSACHEAMGRAPGARVDTAGE